MKRILTTALIAAAAAGALAGPAAATDDVPKDKNGKKSCKEYAGGGYHYVPHGTTRTVTVIIEGEKFEEKIKCSDGDWTQALVRDTRVVHRQPITAVQDLTPLGA
jgi:hypothetical protein